MSDYNPDSWVIIEISGDKVPELYHRVLAGWYGGYLNGDSWKINSGITKIVEHDHHYEVHGSSGSVYNCHKSAERFSGMTSSIYESYSAKNSSDVRLDLVAMTDILTQYKVN